MQKQMPHLTIKNSLEDFFRLNPLQKKGLKKLGLQTAKDLLYYFPSRYINPSVAYPIKTLKKGDSATVFGKIQKLETSKSFKSKIPMARGVVEDSTGKIDVVWFHQPYIAKMLNEGALVKVEGVVGERDGKLYFSNPKTEKIAEIPIGVGSSLFGSEHQTGLYPVYSESKGLSSLWIYHGIQKLIKLNLVEQIEDAVPEEIIGKFHLPSLKTSLIWIHSPKNENDKNAALKRFAFEEVFFIQLQKQKEKKLLEKLPSVVIEHTKENVDKFLSRFSFKLTDCQQKSIDQILEDFKKGIPMSRLLEGDVGSGKTVVASATAYAVTQNHPKIDGKEKDFGNFQIAIMAPTEILAVQHFESFISYFKHLPISIALMTSSACKKFPSKVDPEGSTTISKSQLLKWVENGEISIVIGTHSLIAKKVKFKNLAYVIIDEQHRFGTRQRQALARKDAKGNISVPHLLSMTATPIPRTLALTIYGDLDLSILDEMPAGRKKIITEIVLPNARDAVYENIRRELISGRQAYIICPRIDEPDPDRELALNVKSVKAEAKRLKEKVFPENEGFKIDIIHSKMPPKEKERIMGEFYSGKIDILVSTSVVEVGVNVPNATVIVIEGAERFGLSQLHQLRGRVLRSNHQAYCFVFASVKSPARLNSRSGGDTTIERLSAFKNAKNGFELAELDLKLRGAGLLGGGKQWGISDIAMLALQNLKMVESARAEAKALIEKDPELKNYPLLQNLLQEKDKYHLE